MDKSIEIEPVKNSVTLDPTKNSVDVVLMKVETLYGMVTPVQSVVEKKEVI